MQVPPTSFIEPEEPLPSRRKALWTCGVGVGLVMIATLMGLEGEAGLDGPRAILAMLGLVVTGAALSQRCGDIALWVGAFGAALLAVRGFPASWDSFRLVAGVFAAIALLGMILVKLPRRGRLIVASLLISFHFLGIFTAITGARDQPWLCAQMWVRIYRPYLLFIWQNNSYQFFAPDPGAPSELWFCIEYDTSDPERRFDWVVVPRRSDMRDPLLNSYYRRIILPEQVSYGFFPSSLMDSELLEINALRESPVKNPVTGEEKKIPHHSSQPASRQLLIPNPGVQHLILPSYVQHVALTHQIPGMKIKSIKAYRVLHAHVPAEHFVACIDEDGKKPRRITPYDPTTFLPYYLGTFDASGQLASGSDQLLWWMVPILAKPDLKIPPAYFREMKEAEYDSSFADDVKFHAGTDGYRKGP